MTRDVYMVHVNSGGSCFVKELEFFRSQGGFTDAWGEGWAPVVATSIEDARRLGARKWEDVGAAGRERRAMSDDAHKTMVECGGRSL